MIFAFGCVGFFMRTYGLGLLLMISMQLQAATDFDREQIQRRISPVGNVRLEEDPQKTQIDSEAKKEELVKKSPTQTIYEQYCMTCHRDGLAGAPKLHDEADWKPRLLKKNIDALTATAMKGINAMPPKGTCQECTEADLKAVIEYMVPPS